MLNIWWTRHSGAAEQSVLSRPVTTERDQCYTAAPTLVTSTRAFISVRRASQVDNILIFLIHAMTIMRQNALQY